MSDWTGAPMVWQSGGTTETWVRRGWKSNARVHELSRATVDDGSNVDRPGGTRSPNIACIIHGIEIPNNINHNQTNNKTSRPANTLIPSNSSGGGFMITNVPVNMRARTQRCL